MKLVVVSDEIHEWIMERKTSTIKSADLALRQIKKELEEFEKENEKHE